MKTLQKMLQTLTFDIKSFDDETRSFLAVASDESIDRQGEAIAQDGWDLENYKKNPVVLWGHDYSQPPIGKTLEIGTMNGKLMFRPSFASAEEYSFADTIWKLYRNGFMKAFSVGFIPKEMEGDTFTSQELLEISAVTVPANANALALAYKEGTIDNKERKDLIGHLKAQIKTLESLEKSDADITDPALPAEGSVVSETLESLKLALATLHDALSTIKTGVIKEESQPTGNAEPIEGEGETVDDAKSEPETVSDGAEDVDPENLTDEQAEQVRLAVIDAVEKSTGKVD